MSHSRGPSHSMRELQKDFQLQRLSVHQLALRSELRLQIQLAHESAQEEEER